MKLNANAKSLWITSLSFLANRPFFYLQLEHVGMFFMPLFDFNFFVFLYISSSFHMYHKPKYALNLNQH